jgi:hypothetical protein
MAVPIGSPDDLGGLDRQHARPCDHQVTGRGGGADRAGQDRAVERLAEHDRRGLEYPAAPLARRIGLARPDRYRNSLSSAVPGC